MVRWARQEAQPETSDNRGNGDENLELKNAPQALQILFPTSSLLQRGVVLVPQFAQLSAPTAALTFLPPTLLTAATVPVASGLAPSALALGDAPSPATGDAAAAGGAEAASGFVDAAMTSAAFSILDDTAMALLKVGHPEHAVVPPVPSHRPSPGHVPPMLVVCGVAVTVGPFALAADIEGCCLWPP